MVVSQPQNPKLARYSWRGLVTARQEQFCSNQSIIIYKKSFEEADPPLSQKKKKLAGWKIPQTLLATPSPGPSHVSLPASLSLAPRLAPSFKPRPTTSGLKHHYQHHPISESSSNRPLNPFIVPTITVVHSISINSIHSVALYNNTVAAVAVLLDRLALSPRKLQPTLRLQHAATAATARGSRRE